jgi:hypothetical protein
MRSTAIRTDRGYYGITITGHSATAATPHTFTAASFGYATQGALSVNINNVGKNPTGALTIVLEGANADRFEVVSSTLGSISVNGSRNFTVRPKTGLPRGIHEATVKVSGGSGGTVFEASFNVRFTVNGLAGMAVTGVPTVESLTHNRIVVNEVFPGGTNPGNQVVEYAITTSTATTAAHLATLVWQEDREFPGLNPGTVYYVFARTKVSDSHNAGAALRSVAIRTAPTP